ncbi:hypothetical protein RCL1_002495 [Eukaryota sp. TZLM3-RCL]
MSLPCPHNCLLSKLPCRKIDINLPRTNFSNLTYPCPAFSNRLVCRGLDNGVVLYATGCFLNCWIISTNSVVSITLPNTISFLTCSQDSPFAAVAYDNYCTILHLPDLSIFQSFLIGSRIEALSLSVNFLCVSTSGHVVPIKILSSSSRDFLIFDPICVCKQDPLFISPCLRDFLLYYTSNENYLISFGNNSSVVKVFDFPSRLNFQSNFLIVSNFVVVSNNSVIFLFSNFGQFLGQVTVINNSSEPIKLFWASHKYFGVILESRKVKCYDVTTLTLVDCFFHSSTPLELTLPVKIHHFLCVSLQSRQFLTHCVESSKFRLITFSDQLEFSIVQELASFPNCPIKRHFPVNSQSFLIVDACNLIFLASLNDSSLGLTLQQFNLIVSADFDPNQSKMIDLFSRLDLSSTDFSAMTLAPSSSKFNTVGSTLLYPRGSGGSTGDLKAHFFICFDTVLPIFAAFSLIIDAKNSQNIRWKISGAKEIGRPIISLRHYDSHLIALDDRFKLTIYDLNLHPIQILQSSQNLIDLRQLKMVKVVEVGSKSVKQSTNDWPFLIACPRTTTSLFCCFYKPGSVLSFLINLSSEELISFDLHPSGIFLVLLTKSTNNQSNFKIILVNISTFSSFLVSNLNFSPYSIHFSSCGFFIYISSINYLYVYDILTKKFLNRLFTSAADHVIDTSSVVILSSSSGLVSHLLSRELKGLLSIYKKSLEKSLWKESFKFWSSINLNFDPINYVNISSQFEMIDVNNFISEVQNTGPNQLNYEHLMGLKFNSKGWSSKVVNFDS